MFMKMKSIYTSISLAIFAAGLEAERFFSSDISYAPLQKYSFILSLIKIKAKLFYTCSKRKEPLTVRKRFSGFVIIR